MKLVIKQSVSIFHGRCAKPTLEVALFFRSAPGAGDDVISQNFPAFMFGAHSEACRRRSGPTVAALAGAPSPTKLEFAQSRIARSACFMGTTAWVSQSDAPSLIIWLRGELLCPTRKHCRITWSNRPRVLQSDMVGSDISAARHSSGRPLPALESAWSKSSLPRTGREYFISDCSSITTTFEKRRRRSSDWSAPRAALGSPRRALKPAVPSKLSKPSSSFRMGRTC